MDYIIYICSYFLSAIILYLFIHDVKKFKDRLYYEITNEIWIKTYCLISIFVIHIIWLFSILFLNYDDNSIIYGLPYFLILPYIIYLATDLRTDLINNNTIASQKINKYLNYLMTIYLFIIIFITIIPNKIKKNIISNIKNFIHKYL